MAGAPLNNSNAAKGFQLTAMLVKALEDNNKSKLREGIEKVSTAFAEGERWAIEFVFDRTEGKPAQAVKLSGDQENPINVNHGLSEPLTNILNDIIGRG